MYHEKRWKRMGVYRDYMQLSGCEAGLTMTEATHIAARAVLATFDARHADVPSDLQLRVCNRTKSSDVFNPVHLGVTGYASWTAEFYEEDAQRFASQDHKIVLVIYASATARYVREIAYHEAWHIMHNGNTPSCHDCNKCTLHHNGMCERLADQFAEWMVQQEVQ